MTLAAWPQPREQGYGLILLKRVLPTKMTDTRLVHVNLWLFTYMYSILLLHIIPELVSPHDAKH